MTARTSTRQRIDLVLARLVALFGFVFTVQSIPAMLGAASGVSIAWAVIGPVWWTIAIAAAAICSVIGRWARVSAGVVAATFVLLVVLWPVGVPDTSAAAGVQPWIWYVFTLAIAAAAIAVPPFVAGGYAIVVAVLYVALRISPAGGAATAMPVAIETAYSVIIGAIVVVVVGTLRNAASKVDSAQATAIERYTVAARQHAVELERTRIDAIVHDRVLASLLAAARAESPAQSTVAVEMATRALDELGELSELGEASADGPEEPPPLEPGDALLERLRTIVDAAATVSLEVRRPLPDVPVAVADALCTAAAQAVENSTLHAEPTGAVVLARPVRREVVAGPSSDGVEIVVSDTGAGFVQGDIPADRLGLRVSVVERMRSVGGASSVETAPGAGTRVTLSWHPASGEAAP